MIGSMLAKFDIWQSMAWIRRIEQVKVSAGWVWTEGLRVYCIQLHQQTGQPIVSVSQADKSTLVTNSSEQDQTQNNRTNMNWLVKETITQDYTWYPLGTRWVSN
jgi:hypothetical protein